MHVFEKYINFFSSTSQHRELNEKLYGHPYFPSFSAISNYLSILEVEHLVVKLPAEQLSQIPLPALIELPSNFAILKKLVDNQVEIIHNDDKIQEISLEEFQKLWNGVVLIAETSQKKNLTFNFLKKELWIFFFFCLFSSLLIYFQAPLSFFSLAILDSFSVFISYNLWNHGNSKWLKSNCKKTKNISCDFILSSKYASFGKLSVAELSFVFFSYKLLLLLLSVVTEHTQTITPLFYWLSILVLPICLWSLYIQYIVLKSWCKHCTALVLVLFIEGLIAFLSGWPSHQLTFTNLLFLSFPLFITLLFWKVIDKYKTLKEESIPKLIRFNQLRQHPEIQEAYLRSSKKRNFEPYSWKLKEGHEQGILIDVVLDLFCQPCQKSIFALKKIRQEIGLEYLHIRYWIVAEPSNPEYALLLSYLLKMAQNNPKTAIEVLYSWFDKQNFLQEEFISNLPLKEIASSKDYDLSMLTDLATPSYFINGYKLLSPFEIEDLSYYLKRKIASLQSLENKVYY